MEHFAANSFQGGHASGTHPHPPSCVYVLYNYKWEMKFSSQLVQERRFLEKFSLEEQSAYSCDCMYASN